MSNEPWWPIKWDKGKFGSLRLAELNVGGLRIVIYDDGPHFDVYVREKPAVLCNDLVELRCYLLELSTRLTQELTTDTS